ncbi:hypothetical protein PAV_1c00950 [Paenibacillus alvei DSM 29]|uniref:hypothetical protein n=1 Tax=Paenibacillus alvei TaxID=44250 RepID=UPI0002891B17|nr:hypothetical protein [Paenibacillus alvei]EJW19124.1 hypothetical protein PAV_1c00950 [Paenibacillus alvei DSM 29]
MISENWGGHLKARIEPLEIPRIRILDKPRMQEMEEKDLPLRDHLQDRSCQRPRHLTLNRILARLSQEQVRKGKVLHRTIRKQAAVNPDQHLGRTLAADCWVKQKSIVNGGYLGRQSGVYR